MCAPEKVNLKIGLIAGQGAIPESLILRWESQGLIPVIVGLEGITDPALLKNRISARFSIGQAGHILGFLRSHGVSKVVMVGSLARPNFWTLRTDFLGIKIIVRLLLRQMGDDGLLRFIRREIEKYGMKVVAVHEYMPDILSPSGVLTAKTPTVDDLKIIETGVHLAKQHGAEDRGQSVVVNASGLCALETKDGTNALIKSCAGVVGAILVKVSKPQQDLALDMPTIGISTIEYMIASGLKGLAVESGKTIIIDRDKVVSLCDRNGLFLVGVTV